MQVPRSSEPSQWGPSPVRRPSAYGAYYVGPIGRTHTNTQSQLVASLLLVPSLLVFGYRIAR